jgi:hypothetical protein
MNFMIYWQIIKYLKNILMFHGVKISHDDASITFKLHSFVQMDFLPSM